MIIREKVKVEGQLSISHIATRDGKPVPLVITPRLRAHLRRRGITDVFHNLVVNVGRRHLARRLGGDSSAYVNRVQLGDCLVDGSVQKTPADLSDTRLLHEIRNLANQPGATFDLDEHTYPDEVVKVNASVGTPGVLTAGEESLLTDTSGADFIASGVDELDTVTVVINGEDFTLGVIAVNSATELQVTNPSQLAGAVGYTVQTPGTQVLFRKLVSGDNFPETSFGPVTVVHEAGLLFNDDALFNRVVFQPQDNTIGLVLQPTDIDGTRIDVQLDWLITF